MPQFGMLSHVSSLRLSSGHSGPVLTLSTDYAAHVPVFSPCSLVVDGSLCWQLQLGTCSVGFFSSRLCCPLRFQNSPQALLWEGFLLFGNFPSFITPSPRRVSIPNSFVSPFVFYILPYLLSKRMGCLSGCLVSSASVQKLFCGSCLAFKWSFDEFLEEKVVSLSYSSAILGLPPLYYP